MQGTKMFIVLYCLLVVGLLVMVQHNNTLTSLPKTDQFSTEERQDLERYAAATWNFMKNLVINETGLPARKMRVRDDYRPPLTTVASIACYLWSIIVARDIGLITKQDAIFRVKKTLKTLAVMELYHGHYFKSYDATTLAPAIGNKHVSSVDSAWLAVALILVKNAIPEMETEAEDLLAGMNFDLLRNKHTGFFCRRYDENMDNSNCETYSFLNGETRIAAYIAIGRKQIPHSMYFTLPRTPLNKCSNLKMEMMPGGNTTKEYMGVKVYEGHFRYRNMKIVPTWGGSMFEALMVPLFVPEVEWGTKSWAINHPLYARGQIEHGLLEAKYGLWGFSHCVNPSGGYGAYGVDALGNLHDGHYSNIDNTSVDYGYPECVGTSRIPKPDPPSSAYTNGVVTPHAIFLALPFEPKRALEALKKLDTEYSMFGKYGFLDSVNVQTKEKAEFHLSFDQGMVMASLGNALADNCILKYFAAEPGMKEQLQPMLAMEEFTSGYVSN